MIEIKPGMRVKCIKPDASKGLWMGLCAKVVATQLWGQSDRYLMLKENGYWFAASRFKPIIRVKASRG